jgi:hypothetical protein
MVISRNGKTVTVGYWYSNHGKLNITVCYYNQELPEDRYPNICACQPASHHGTWRTVPKKVNEFLGGNFIHAGECGVYLN